MSESIKTDDPVADPVTIASHAIAEYVARSYECLAQIEMAKRQLAEVAKQVSLAIEPVADMLTTAERTEVFANFYWDAIELPSEPLLLGFGVRPIGKMIKGIPCASTGVPCLGCGEELTAKSRTDLRQIQSAERTLCKDCRGRALEASGRVRKQQQNMLQRAWSERQAMLRSMPYADYLRSPEWHQTRAAALKRSRYRCQLCGAFQWVTLDVHHNTYERRGCELPADVIVLCRQCHTKHHTELPESDVNQTGVWS